MRVNRQGCIGTVGPHQQVPDLRYSITVADNGSPRKNAAIQTLTQDLYLRVRGDILAGRLSPGQRLKIDEIRAQNDVGLNVAREAFSRLTGEGLVRSVPQHGFFVTDLSPVDHLQLTEARVAVESIGLRWAVARGDLAWEGQVLAAHHVLESTSMAPEEDEGRFSQKWVAAHTAFHSALVQGCGNDRLLAVITSLRDSAEIYRRWSQPYEPGDGRDLRAEHSELARLIIARESDAAVGLLGRHLQPSPGTLHSSTPV